MYILDKQIYHFMIVTLYSFNNQSLNFILEGSND